MVWLVKLTAYKLLYTACYNCYVCTPHEVHSLPNAHTRNYMNWVNFGLTRVLCAKFNMASKQLSLLTFLGESGKQTVLALQSHSEKVSTESEHETSDISGPLLRSLGILITDFVPLTICGIPNIHGSCTIRKSISCIVSFALSIYNKLPKNGSGKWVSWCSDL